jgi:hypothetical protein
MQFSVEEWSTGQFKPKRLDDADMPEKFLCHMECLGNFEKSAGRCFFTLREAWYNYGL